MSAKTDQFKRLQSGPYEDWTILIRGYENSLFDNGRVDVLMLRPQNRSLSEVLDEQWYSEWSANFPRPIISLIDSYRQLNGYAGMSLLEFLVRALSG